MWCQKLQVFFSQACQFWKANHSNVQNARHIEGKLQITAYYKNYAATITAKWKKELLRLRNVVDGWQTKNGSDCDCECWLLITLLTLLLLLLSSSPSLLLLLLVVLFIIIIIIIIIDIIIVIIIFFFSSFYQNTW